MVSEVYIQAVNMSLDAIVSANESGIVTLWNRASEKIFGYTENEALGMHIENLVPDEYRERHRVGFKNFLLTGKGPLIGKVVDVKGLRKDGTTFPIEMSLEATRVEGSWAFTAVMRDITERKRLEDELRERLEETERLNKLMIGRELKMEEMRKELFRLKRAQGES